MGFALCNFVSLSKSSLYSQCMFSESPSESTPLKGFPGNLEPRAATKSDHATNLTRDLWEKHRMVAACEQDQRRQRAGKIGGFDRVFGARAVR